jgi:pimeloyl-ACP methyl ester carboxylesterase
MWGLQASFLGLVLCSSVGANEPRVTAEAFQAWFKAASRGELEIPEPVVRRAQGFRYVFVGGIRMGRMPGYFQQNAKELRAQGVSRRAIHFVLPSSDRTVEENCDTVREEFLRIAGLGSERLVVIAHSRGACDALAFALDDPEFVRDHIEALFLMQAPFGGTGLADYVLGEGEAIDGRMPRSHRVAASLIGSVERFLLKWGWHGGMDGLTREASRAYWRRVLEEHADAIPVVGPKVYYVASKAEPAQLSPFQRAMAWYLGPYYGPNDGMVVVGDQTLCGVGTSLGVLDAGHADLTRRFPASRAGRRFRRALVQSILMAIGGSDVS